MVKIVIVETENELRLVEDGSSSKINWSIAGDNVWLVTNVQTSPQKAEVLMDHFLTIVKKQQKKIILLCEPARVYFPQTSEAQSLLKEIEVTRYKRFVEKNESIRG